MSAPAIIDRRRVLAGGGALIVSFSLSSALAQQQDAPAAAPAPSPPGSLKTSPYLDAWIRIDANGRIEVFTGKAELGQGFKTAFQQIAAEELDVAFESLKVTMEWYTIQTPILLLSGDAHCRNIPFHFQSRRNLINFMKKNELTEASPQVKGMATVIPQPFPLLSSGLYYRKSLH